MEKISLRIEKNECEDLTRDLFLKMSGINKTGEKFDRMKEDADNIRDRIEDRIDIKVACHYYNGKDDLKLDGRAVRIGSEIFQCNAFELLNESDVNGVYVYALTAGEYDSKEESILNRLYADIWGTSFTEAARILMSKELGKRDELSDSFGPGFYGMDLIEMSKIDRLLGFEKIGIELKKSGILVPVKSCAGLLFSVTDSYQKMNSACRDCLGNHKSCKLCRQMSNN